MTAALNPLIGGIVRVIDYYASRAADASIENVMITGLGANFRGMSALLEREVSRPVSVRQWSRVVLNVRRKKPRKVSAVRKVPRVPLPVL